MSQINTVLVGFSKNSQNHRIPAKVKIFFSKTHCLKSKKISVYEKRQKGLFLFGGLQYLSSQMWGIGMSPVPELGMPADLYHSEYEEDCRMRMEPVTDERIQKLNM